MEQLNKQQLKYTDICITSFNNVEQWFKDWTKVDKSIVKYIIIQGELCKDGKKHVQGFIQFNGQKRMEQIKRFFGDNQMHIEKRMGSVEQARDYCTELKHGVWRQYEEYGEIQHKIQGKRTDLIGIRDQLMEGQTFQSILEETQDAKLFGTMLKYYKPLREFEFQCKAKIVKQQLLKEYDNVVWKPYQIELMDILDAEVDSRKVHWVYDEIGNNGKSYLSKYLKLTRDVYYITSGKVQDILYAYNDEPIIIIDLARTQADNVDHIYSCIEMFKNGMYLSTKYETRQRIFNIPHIIIMANFKPDETKLSNDRWNIMEVRNGEFIKQQDTQLTIQEVSNTQYSGDLNIIVPKTSIVWDSDDDSTKNVKHLTKPVKRLIAKSVQKTAGKI